MSISRRRFLSWIGAAGITAMGSRARASTNREFNGYPESLGVLHDTTHCVGCRSCEAACSRVNELPAPQTPFSDLSVLNQKRRTTPANFTVVNKAVPGGGRKPIFYKSQCNHCLEPACASACFVRAFTKTREGAVIYDSSVCVGCRYCMIACPFEIPTYEYDKAFSPRIRKCTLCHSRVVQGLLPGCVESCPTEALSFGRREDLLRLARGRIRNHPERYVDHIYGEHEMGGTSWLYLSGVPFGNLGMREDLGTTPAPDLTSGALSTVPMVAALWPVLLTGVYAISRRREEASTRDREQSVARALAEAKAQSESALAAAAEKAKREKEEAVQKAVKLALEQSAKKPQGNKEA